MKMTAPPAARALFFAIQAVRDVIRVTFFLQTVTQSGIFA